MRYTTLSLVLLNALVVLCHDSEEDHEDTATDQTETEYKQNVAWDAIHWLATVTMLFIVPSISASAIFAHRSLLSTNLSIISAIYATFEAIFLRFNDPNGHENRTSRGAVWFMVISLGATSFCGLVYNGSTLLPKSVSNASWATAGSGFFRTLMKILSVVSALAGWVRSCLAVVALLGFCYTIDGDNHTGQCLAHGIMGTGFVAYGFLLLLVLQVPWLRERTTGKSQDFYDSLIISVWGCINTFTEHRPWEPWSHSDYQHTAMGIIWWCLGLVGIYMSSDGSRSFIPGLVIAFTGWSMSVHVQHMELSTKVHYFFGLALMFAGFARVIEICFLLKDERFVKGKIMTFQYFCPMALVESGIMFMSANEEQLMLIHDIGAGHSSYIMVITSAAALVFYLMLMFLNLYLKFMGCDKNSGAGYIGLDSEETVEANVAEFELASMENSDEETPST